MSRRRGTMNPPQLNANVEATHKYRFVSTAAFNGPVSVTTLLGAIGSMTTLVAGTTTVAIANSCKLLSVECWAPVSAQGATTTVALEWPINGQNMAREVSDSSNSVSRVAHIKCKPPRLSLSGYWNSYFGTDTILCNLNVPIATIIDVAVAFVLNDGPNNNPINSVSAGAVPGVLYYGYLDSITAAGAVLKPVTLIPIP